MSLYHLYRTDTSLFAKTLEYMPIESVGELCKDRRFLDFCLGKSNKALNQWKSLIDSTYGEYPGFVKYLNDVRRILRAGDPELTDFNYKVYVNLIKMFDPVTQLIIWRKKGDSKFDESSMVIKAIALYVLCLQGYDACDELRQNNFIAADGKFLQEVSVEKPSDSDIERLVQIAIDFDVPILIKLYLPFMAKDMIMNRINYILSNNRNIIAELILAHFDNIYLYGETLRAALIRGNPDVVKYILDSKYTFKSIYNKLFEDALAGRNAKSIEYLIDSGMPVTLEMIYRSLHFIPGFEVLMQHYPLDFNTAQQIIDHVAGDFNIKQISNDYIERKKYELIRTILVNTTSKEASLMYAISKGYVDIVSDLLDGGANIHYGNERPLFIATLNNNVELVKLLLNRGADPEEAWEIFTTNQKNNFLPSIREAYITAYILNQGTGR